MHTVLQIPPPHLARSLTPSHTGKPQFHLATPPSDLAPPSITFGHTSVPLATPKAETTEWILNYNLQTSDEAGGSSMWDLDDRHVGMHVTEW